MTHPIVFFIQSWMIRLASRRKIIELCWVPSHMNIRGNKHADREGKAAATDQATDVLNTRVPPYLDFYGAIKSKTRERWQHRWTSIDEIRGRIDKLRQIKHTVQPWSTSLNKSKRYEVVLTKLRIGHSLLTHGYLMEERHPPYCQDCLVPLTIKHILAECPSLQERRRRHFGFLSASQDGDRNLRNIINNRKNLI